MSYDDLFITRGYCVTKNQSVDFSFTVMDIWIIVYCMKTFETIQILYHIMRDFVNIFIDL